MDKKLEEIFKNLIESLADIEHQRWSDWQSYLHSKLTYTEWRESGITFAGYLMDAGNYERWQRQIETPYSDLSEKEKDSDREQVKRYFSVLEDAIKSYAKDYALSLLPEERGGYSPGIRKYTNKTFNECIKQIKDKIK